MNYSLELPGFIRKGKERSILKLVEQKYVLFVYLSGSVAQY
jgi:hypothetical protein